VAAFLAPVVSFERDYCLKDCHRCTQVCPTGAIARLSLAKKAAARMGRAQVDPERCRPPEHSECSACMNVCPYEAIRIEPVPDEYQSLPKVDPDKCPGCGACQVACPATPKAIVIEPYETG
jgi:ferredoxin